jgi:hypothetical protein
LPQQFTFTPNEIRQQPMAQLLNKPEESPHHPQANEQQQQQCEAPKPDSPPKQVEEQPKLVPQNSEMDYYKSF